MKKIFLTALAMFGILAVTSLAEPGKIDREILTVTTHATTNTLRIASTNTVIRGWIDTIELGPTTGATGILTVATVPELSSQTAVTLAVATNETSFLLIRPRFDGTDPAGAALTGDPPWRFGMCGDGLMLSVTNSGTTNATFKAVVKYLKN